MRAETLTTLRQPPDGGNGIDDQRPAVTEVDEIGGVAVAFIDHGDDISHVDPPQAHTPSGRSGDRAVAGVAPDTLTDAVLGAPIVGLAASACSRHRPARRAVGVPVDGASLG